MVFIQFTIRSIKELKVSVRFKSQNKSDDRKFKFPILFFCQKQTGFDLFCANFCFAQINNKKSGSLKLRTKNF